MKNKTIIIFLISILSILVLFLTLFMILVIKGDFKSFDFSISKNIIYDEKYESIDNLDVDVSATEVEIKKTDDKLFRVVIYGKENDKKDFTIKTNDNILKIKEKKFSCFGLCFNNSKIIVYIPNDYKNKIDITSSSGDVVSKDLISNVKIKTSSGDIVGKFDNAKLYTSSGDIVISKLKNYIKASTSSGDIVINEMNINKDSSVNTSSGDVLIKEINNVYIETNTSSGDVILKTNNRFSKEVLSINTSSGDIFVK